MSQTFSGTTPVRARTLRVVGAKPQDGKELTLSEIYHKLLLEKEHEKFCLMT